MKVIAVVTLFAAVAVAVPIDLLEQQQNGQQIVLLTAASNSQTDGALHRSKRAIGNQLVVPVVRFVIHFENLKSLKIHISFFFQKISKSEYALRSH